MQRYLLHEQGHWKLVGLWCASSEETGLGAAEVTLAALFGSEGRCQQLFPSRNEHRCQGLQITLCKPDPKI